MEEKRKALFIFKTWRDVERRLAAGLLIVVPLWLTYVALKFFFSSLDGFFAPLVRKTFGISIPGLGFILLLTFLYLIGMVTSNIIGRSLVHFWESILNRIPLVKNIYQGAKQLIQAVSASRKMGFKRVVFIEYPRIGFYAVGFVTNTVQEKESAKKLAIVFLPSPPNPVNGFFVVVPETDLIDTNLTMEEGVKLVVSAGMISPSTVQMYRASGAKVFS